MLVHRKFIQNRITKEDVLKVILVRHGVQDVLQGGLLPEGVQQIKDSAEKIKSFLAVQKISSSEVFLVSSPLSRAEQSADIISKLIAVDVKIDEKLPDRSRKAVKIVEKHLAVHSVGKAIIIVSHLSQLEDILEHFEEKLPRSFSHIPDVKTGSAILIDLEAAEIEHIA